MNNHTLNLLLVEDSEDDVFLMSRALRKAGLSVHLQIAVDGQEALDYLQGAGKYADRTAFPLPDIVFLDLKLPYVHGFDVLAWLRQQAAFSELAVVVLTSSPLDRDRERAQELGANAYLVKPPDGEMLLEVLRSVKQSASAVCEAAPLMADELRLVLAVPEHAAATPCFAIIGPQRASRTQY